MGWRTRDSSNRPWEEPPRKGAGGGRESILSPARAWPCVGYERDEDRFVEDGTRAENSYRLNRSPVCQVAGCRWFEPNEENQKGTQRLLRTRTRLSMEKNRDNHPDSYRDHRNHSSDNLLIIPFNTGLHRHLLHQPIQEFLPFVESIYPYPLVFSVRPDIAGFTKKARNAIRGNSCIAQIQSVGCSCRHRRSHGHTTP